jgi:hypothetical protein
MSPSARHDIHWALQIAVLCAFAMTFSGNAHAAKQARSWRIDEALTWIGFKIAALPIIGGKSILILIDRQKASLPLPSNPLRSTSVPRLSTTLSRARLCSTLNDFRR